MKSDWENRPWALRVRKIYGIAMNVIPWISCVLLVGFMVGLSELLDQREIIFPEITALAIGYVVAPKRSWKVNGRRMWLLITGCAIGGLVIVRFVPVSYYLQIMIAFTIAQILYAVSRTTLAPFVSAIVLPVVLQSDSIVYPIAASLLTLAIVLLHEGLVILEVRQDEEFIPSVNLNKDAVLGTIGRIVCTAILVWISIKMDWIFVISPPLLVAFTEFSRRGHPARKKPLRIVAFMTFAALTGSICRYVLTMRMGMHLMVAAMVATVILLFVVKRSGMFMPPAGAVVILAMLISEDRVMVFPLQILLGITLIMMITILLFTDRYGIIKKKAHPLNAGEE